MPSRDDGALRSGHSQQITTEYYSPDFGLSLRFEPDVIEKLQRAVTEAGDVMTGGRLAGEMYESGGAKATVARDPPPDSELREDELLLGSEGEQEWLDEMWDKGVYHLGSWHTYPREPFTLSDDDKEAMFEMTNGDDYGGDIAALVVIGDGPDGFTLNAYLFGPDEHDELEPTPPSPLCWVCRSVATHQDSLTEAYTCDEHSISIDAEPIGGPQ